MFKIILFNEMKISKLISYSTNICQSCQATVIGIKFQLKIILNPKVQPTYNFSIKISLPT
jgi:hypothetical protein